MSEKDKDENLENEEQENSIEETVETTNKKEQAEEQQTSKEVEEDATIEIEQLDDDEFDNEKARIKAEKEAKKLEKKKAKQVYDADGNPIEKKKMKKSTKFVLIIILLVIIAVVGVLSYMIINPNNELNVFSKMMIEGTINDYLIYYNNEDWEEYANKVDLNGFLSCYAIEIDETLAEQEETDKTLSFLNYDEIYADLDACYDELAEIYPDYYVTETYEQLKEAITYGQTNQTESFELWTSLAGMSSIEIESVKSITKMENTESLYKVSIIYSYTDTSTGSTETDSDDIYVARIDGEYKIVGGDLASIVMSAYYYEFYYNYTS